MTKYIVQGGHPLFGEVEISGVQYIERGYEDIVTKLQGLGASIRTVEVPGESEELEAHIG